MPTEVKSMPLVDTMIITVSCSSTDGVIHWNSLGEMGNPRTVVFVFPTNVHQGVGAGVSPVTVVRDKTVPPSITPVRGWNSKSSISETVSVE